MTNSPTDQSPALIKTSPHVKDQGLAEIYQSMKNKMALLRPEADGTYTRITPYVLCRDFVVDVFTYAKAGEVFSIYSMTFDPTKEKVLMDRACIAMKFPNKKAKTNFMVNLPRLHAIEDANKFTHTVVKEVEELEVIIEGSGKWLESCLLWSLYTSLLRCFCYGLESPDWIAEFKETYPDKTDAKLVGSLDRGTFDKILADLSVLVTSDWCGFSPKEFDVGVIHHNSGFYSVFGSHLELNPDSVRQNKHWKQFKEAGWQLHTK